MISIEPQTTIVLCSVPWEEDYKNQRTFENATKQAEYFNSLNKLVFTNFTYQRKEGYVDVGANIETLRNFNYVYYTNTGFTNKIFYAFITNMEYIGENVTRLTIETDVFQTWQFDLVYHKCFVEREHVTNDAIGLHTVPENLETGEYICNNITYLNPSGTSCYICIATTSVPTTTPNIPTSYANYYGSVFSGTYYVLFSNVVPATSFIHALDNEDKADAIQSIFMIPIDLCKDDSGDPPTFDVYSASYTSPTVVTYNIELAMLPRTSNPIIMNSSINVDMPSTLNGYTPKNNKLKCYPFNYFYVSDNIGNSIEYHYEDFVNNEASFRTIGTPTPGCSIFCYPLNYKKLQDDLSFDYGSSYNYGLPVPKYPFCGWNSDAYTNWLVQNGRNLDLTTLTGAAGIGAGLGLIATGLGTIAGIGMIAGGVAAIGSTITQAYSHSLVPPQGNGTNSADITFTSNNYDMPAKQMSVRYEYAKIIDDFFEMFGYKVNSLKEPNITGRPYWNYVKTIDCNVEGDIPNEDLLLIRKMFDNGVTLWHTNNMHDYSLNNH